MKEFLVYERPHTLGRGVQKVYRFPNKYGASVIRFTIGEFAGSYGSSKGLWEVAVLHWRGETEKEGFDLCYTTPITDDVLGRLSEAEIEEVLQRIKELEAAT